jgi:eukaryotic-like serine/threonine-protein kinase
VYVGASDGKLYALNISNGRLAWSYQAENAINDSPTLAGGVLLIGSQGGTLYALNAFNGTALFSTFLGVALTSPAVANGVIYIGSADGTLYTLYP